MLAISSGGGHWVQLNRLRPAFEHCDVAYATVDERYREMVQEARFHVVHQATRWDRWGLVKTCVSVLRILLKERPDVILSTGSAPGAVALRLGKLFRARTIWVDSIANVEQLSMSGEKVGRHADLWLTQWPHLARPEGPRYEGAVL